MLSYLMASSKITKEKELSGRLPATVAFYVLMSKEQHVQVCDATMQKSSA